MENNKYAQLNDEMLEKLTELENQLDVILIAYDPATIQIHEEDYPSNQGAPSTLNKPS